MGVADAVDEQGLDIGPQLAEDRVLLDDLGPGVEREERLHGSRRAGVEWNNSAFDARMEEKRHVNRNEQVFPLRVRHLEVSQKLCATGYAPVLASGHAIEKSRAGFAGTDNLSGGDLNQVRMLMRHGEAAQLAAFGGPPGAGELSERRKCLV